MNPTNEQTDGLERLIGRALRDQPPIKAPRSLEARVLREIELRSAGSRWSAGFSRWPIAARAAFGVLSVAAMGLLTRVPEAPVKEVLGTSAEKVQVARSISNSLVDVGAYVLDGIPSYWLYAGALGCAVAYLTLFGLGAAAYKVIYK